MLWLLGWQSTENDGVSVLVDVGVGGGGGGGGGGGEEGVEGGEGGGGGGEGGRRRGGGEYRSDTCDMAS